MAEALGYISRRSFETKLMADPDVTGFFKLVDTYLAAG